MDSYRNASSINNASVDSSRSSSVRQPTNLDLSKVQSAKADIEVDHNIIVSDGELLKEEFTKFEDWGEADDDDIEIAMKTLDAWRKKVR